VGEKVTNAYYKSGKILKIQIKKRDDDDKRDAVQIKFKSSRNPKEKEKRGKWSTHRSVGKRIRAHPLLLGQ